MANRAGRLPFFIAGSMRRLLIALLTLCLLVGWCQAEIREISSLHQITPELRAGTLLVLDLDNTLIEPEGNLGSDQWFYFLVRKFRARDGMSPAEAEHRAMEEWNRVQPSLQIRAVEADAARIIRSAQDRGFATLGLTARTPEIAQTTFAQLRKIGVHLARRTIPAREFALPGAHPILFREGVLFVGESNKKGRVLMDFLKRTGAHPARVLFVDDKRRHVKDVDREMRNAGWPCISFRYGAADAKVARFNAETRDLRSFLGETSDRPSKP